MFISEIIKFESSWSQTFENGIVKYYVAHLYCILYIAYHINLIPVYTPELCKCPLVHMTDDCQLQKHKEIHLHILCTGQSWHWKTINHNCQSLNINNPTRAPLMYQLLNINKLTKQPCQILHTIINQYSQPKQNDKWKSTTLISRYNEYYYSRLDKSSAN